MVLRRTPCVQHQGVCAEKTVVDGGITQNTFTDGVAVLRGGGLDAVNSTLGTVTANRLLTNQAGQSGAAIALRNSTATIKGNMFTDNLISNDPGAAASALFAVGGAVTGAESNVYVPVKGGFLIE